MEGVEDGEEIGAEGVVGMKDRAKDQSGRRRGKWEMENFCTRLSGFEFR